MTGAFERIYEVVRRIPYGRVATYGRVALLAGNPRWARVVGYALHASPDPAGISCYRVVNRLGRCRPHLRLAAATSRPRFCRARSGFGPDGRVDLARFGWNPVHALALVQAAAERPRLQRPGFGQRHERQTRALKTRRAK
ncbi:MAG: MGMT family protein [Oscillospiraceae bacterium]